MGLEKRGYRYWEGGIVPHLVASKVGREKRGYRLGGGRGAERKGCAGTWDDGIDVPHLVASKVG